jgi:outer membrane protein
MFLRFLALAVAFTASAASRAQTEPLTVGLPEVLAAAEQANVSVLIGREGILQARAEADRERAGLLPRVNFEAEQRRTQNVQVSRAGPTVSAPTNRFDATLVGNLSVLNPAAIASYRAARQGVAIAETELQQTLQQVLAVVGDTYFRHLRNLQRISVLDANITRARALLDLAQRQLNAGVATQIDVTRAEALVAVAEQARLQQNTVVYDSELQLKRLLNVDPTRPLQVQPFEVRRADMGELTSEQEQEAFSRRPDYVRAEQLLEQTRQALRSVRLQRIGSLNVFGEYGYSGSRVLDGRTENSWLGGVAVTVPVFDAGRISADARLIESAARAQEHQLRNLQLGITAELRLAAQDARSRFMQIGVAERSHRLAEDELRLAQVRFERGAADNREVIEAQNRLALASDNLVEAIYQYNVSRLELARARGDVREILTERAL